MGYTGEQRGSAQPQPQQQYRRIDNPPAGAMIIEEAPPLQTSSPVKRGRWAMPSLRGGRMEQLGFLVILLAAVVILLLFAGRIIGPVMGGLITGFYTSMFVALLTLANLRRPSGWANSLLGRQVFPVLNVGSDGQIWKLALVNGMLMFVFTFAFHVLASFITSFFAGIVVFGGLIMAAIFYSRARGVIRRP